LVPEDALIVVTPIVNNQVYFDCSIEYGKDVLKEIKEQMNISGNQIDWLTHYTTNEGIDISVLSMMTTLQQSGHIPTRNVLIIHEIINVMY
jgi:hypothetical protein